MEETQQEHTIKCVECGSRNLDNDESRGELVCLDCGLVVEDSIIDQGAEWRVFSPEAGDDRSRTGAPMSMMMHDKGLSTEIGWQNKDYSGRSLSGKSRSHFYRMRKWQSRSRVSNAQERNLVVALQEIDRMGSRLGLPKTARESCALLYRKAFEAGIVRGRSIDGVAASCIYIACRQCGIPRTLDEVVEVSRCGRKEIGRTERFILKKLKIRLPVPRALDFLSRFCSELELDASTELLARRMCEQLEALELDSGRGPTGLAASTIYIAGILNSQHRTQKEVSEVSGVTEVTVRNRYKEIARVLELDITV